MIRVGIVDFDTSHVIQFTKRLNHIDIDEDQWVDGAKGGRRLSGAVQTLSRTRSRVHRSDGR